MLRTVFLLVCVLAVQTFAGVHYFQITSKSIDEFEERVQRLEEIGYDVRLTFPNTNELIAYSVLNVDPSYSFVINHFAEGGQYAALNTPVQKAFGYLCTAPEKEVDDYHE